MKQTIEAMAIIVAVSLVLGLWSLGAYHIARKIWRGERLGRLLLWVTVGWTVYEYIFVVIVVSMAYSLPGRLRWVPFAIMGGVTAIMIAGALAPLMRAFRVARLQDMTEDKQDANQRRHATV